VTAGGEHERPDARRKLELELEAAELELLRAHRLLDALGVPREGAVEGLDRPQELALSARIELLLEDDEA